MSTKDVTKVMRGLEVGGMFSVKNIEKAIRKIKKGTSPGADGLTTRF